MNNQLAALSMDLKRAALALHHGNAKTADKFISISQQNISKLTPQNDYLDKVIQKIDFTSADNLLMSSQLIQNYCVNTRV